MYLFNDMDTERKDHISDDWKVEDWADSRRFELYVIGRGN